MKYETPKMQVIEISATDVIKTSGSGTTGGDATGNVGGGGNLED